VFNGTISCLKRAFWVPLDHALWKISEKFNGYNATLLLGIHPADSVKGNHRHAVVRVFFSNFFSKGFL
jgi:hypothetical protein